MTSFLLRTVLPRPGNAKGDFTARRRQREDCGRSDSSTSAERVTTAYQTAGSSPGEDAVYLNTAALAIDWP